MGVAGPAPLVYKVRLSGEGSQAATSNCDTNRQTCSLGGLKSGREYSVTVYACIAESETLCGRDSPQLTTRTVPAAPGGIYLVPTSTTELTATITPVGDSTGVDHYNMRLTPGPKECNPLKDSPSCTFSGLSAATQYTAGGKACLSQSNINYCSTEVQTSSWTKPTGM